MEGLVAERKSPWYCHRCDNWLFGTVPVATADPSSSTSPGVPRLEIAQQFAASPPDRQQPLQSAAAAVIENALPPAPAVAPMVDTAAVLPPPVAAAPVLALPPVPAVPDIASLDSLAPSQVTFPTVPGLPVQLPSELSMPHDLVCEVTGCRNASRLARESPVVTASRHNNRPKPPRSSGPGTILSQGHAQSALDAEGSVAVSRVLVATAAVCAFAGMIGVIPAASAEPVPACGPDQATAVDIATARDRHDPITQGPWNPVPLQSNFDPCADLSAVVLSIDMARPSSPRQVFMFHRGTYIGNATSNSRPFTTLDVASSAPNVLVVDFVSGRTCSTCDDGTTHVVRYVWNGATAIMLDPIPPRQNWPIP